MSIIGGALNRIAIKIATEWLPRGVLNCARTPAIGVRFITVQHGLIISGVIFYPGLPTICTLVKLNEPRERSG